MYCLDGLRLIVAGPCDHGDVYHGLMRGVYFPKQLSDKVHISF
jgi:hypothetical protein